MSVLILPQSAPDSISVLFSPEEPNGERPGVLPHRMLRLTCRLLELGTRALVAAVGMWLAAREL